MPVNRFRTQASDPNPVRGSRLESRVDLPDAAWNLVTNYGDASGSYTYNSINDEVGPRSIRVRPCEHTRIQTSSTSVPVPDFELFDGPYRYVYRGVGGFCSGFSTVPYRGDASLAIDGFNRRSIRNIIDEIPTVTSLPTFIGELPDIPRTLKGIKDLLSLPIQGVNPQKLQNFRELRKYKDSISDPVLGWNFGVVPLWNDIKGFLGAQLGVNDRIDELRRTRGVLSRFRNGGTIPGQSFSDPFSPLTTVGPLGVEGRWSGKSRTKVKNGGTFYHELGGLDDYGNKEKALRSSLGLDNLFKAAWDLVPFSFLADYVSNIGDLLGELKTNDAFSGEIQIRDTWSTTTLEASASYEVRFRHPNGTILSGGTMCTGTLRMFNRTPGIPTSAGLLLGSSLNPREVLNLAALV